MDQFVRSRNVERYRRLLERVTEESDLEMFASLNSAILFGLIGCSLVACVIGALMYDVGRLL